MCKDPYELDPDLLSPGKGSHLPDAHQIQPVGSEFHEHPGEIPVIQDLIYLIADEFFHSHVEICGGKRLRKIGYLLSD